jgi:riboflavin kinase, archaea type
LANLYKQNNPSGFGVELLEGIVTSGFGEASYFLSLEYYKNEIKKKLGFDAYPGTLNLKVDEKQLLSLKKLSPIKINPHKKNDEALAGAVCYKAKIGKINGAVIIPEITKHEKNIIEFIAPVNIKSTLDIKEGDKVDLEIE